MKFETLEDFLTYYFTNNIAIGSIDFVIADADDEEIDPTVTADIIEEPPVDEIEPADPGQKLTEVTLHLGSGDFNVVLNESGALVVDEISITPNMCGTGFVTVEGRRLHLNMCECEEKTVAYFTTTIDGVKSANTGITVQLKN